MADNQDNPLQTPSSYAQCREERGFLHHAILFYAVGLMFLLVCNVVWFASDVLLLIFARGTALRLLTMVPPCRVGAPCATAKSPRPRLVRSG